MPLNEEAVLTALKDFVDPETGRSVVQLGLVRQIEIADGRVAVRLGLTSYSAPLWNEAKADVATRLRAQFPEVSDVLVTIEEHRRPAERMGEVGLPAKSVIAVGAGKGGVGKSTIAAAITYGLLRAGSRVGLMDADVYGPSVPHLLGAAARPHLVAGRIQPVNVDGIAVMSMGFLVPPGEAVIWRGPMLHHALTQFLRDTEWGELDYLVVDMPPGTGDVALTLSQLLPLTGAVVVCTPQDLALLDVVKAIAMFRKVNIDVVGMVENMSHFICPSCHARHDIFGSGGARRKAAELDVPFLGEVPLNAQLRVYGDEGRFAASFADPDSATYLEAIAVNLARNLAARRRQKSPLPSLTVLNG